ncbi:MAG: HVO_0476 family zinc finger protein, partial [Candidatus Thermoplasmatota archaeon]|nr:HVO_0476 family zinc finger protein [Candidatus Thermoplasmatota archaeon]
MDEEGDGLDVEEEVLHNAMICPSCAEFEGHDILASKPKGSGHDHRVRCQGCGHVYTVHLRPPKAVVVPFMLTDGPESQMVSLELDADEVLDLDDVFEDGGMLWRVTHLEDSEGRSISTGMAENVRR